MKLELKHMAPYLHHKLMYMKNKNGEIETMKSISMEIDYIDFGWGDAMKPNEIKPILRPLSDLTKDVTIHGVTANYMDFLPMGKADSYNDFIELSKGNKDVLSFRYWIVEKLFEWHFDVFGLIENNLAIDINTL